MIVRSIDSGNDWNYGKGIQDYRSNNAAVSQSIQTRLQSFLGDCFFAVNDGLDWYNLLGKNNQLAINLAVSSCILNTQDVTGLLQLSINVVSSSRSIAISYNVQTVYSVQGLQGSVKYDL